MRRGLVIGAVLGSLPALLFSAWAAHQNPWFLDRPLLWLGLSVLPPALVLGGVGALVDKARPGRWSVSGLLPLALFLLSVRPTPDPVDTRVLVVGIDGATFDLVDELDLPALEGMSDEGSRAVLRSMEPMFSPLLWTTMGSGKPPEEHGVRGFRVQAQDARVPRIWDVVEAEGHSVGVYKWLVTWPPREVDGFIVPAWLAPSPETHPMELSFVKELELANRLKRKQVASRRTSAQLALAGIPRGLRLSTLVEVGKWKWTERTERPQDEQRFVALNLLRGRIDRDVFVWSLHRFEPELATFTYYGTDALGHRCWHLLGEEEDPLRQAYEQADGILGELLDEVGPQTTILVVSDHGFKALETDKLFISPLTERLRDRAEAELGPTQVARLGIKLTITVEQASVAELQGFLASLVDEQGQPFYLWEEVDGSRGSLGLTLANEQLSAEDLERGLVGGEPMSDYASLTDRSFTGDHDPRGVLLAKGPGIAAGAVLEDASLLDIAPTVQALMGVPPAQDLPGRVLFGSPMRGPNSRDALASELYTDQGSGQIDDEALRALGYIE
jgi:hypothetical protein